MSSIIDRKELKAPDELQQRLSEGFGWFVARPKTILAVGGALLGVLIAGGFWKMHQDRKEEEARNAFYLASKPLAQKLAGLQPELPLEEQLGPELAELRSVTEKYPHTRGGFEAMLALGDLYLKHDSKSPEKPLAWYQAAIQSAPQPIDRYLSFYALGFAQQKAAKLDDAIQSFQKALAVSKEDLGLHADILLALAQTHRRKNEDSRALELYDQVIKNYPQSESARIAGALKQ